MLIRTERADDDAAIHALVTAAFESDAEAQLVQRLRREASPCVSLVAEQDGIVVGHVMFTPVTLPKAPSLRIMGLAPLATAATHRRRGVGAALVQSGLERCRQLKYGAVVVLGEPTYYPRFGFRPGFEIGLSCEYDAPPEAFMAVELEPGYFSGASGTIAYHPAFKGFWATARNLIRDPFVSSAPR